jgi:L-asparaginase
VVVFGLGGTIAMTNSDAGGVAPALSAAQLVAAVPGLADLGVETEVISFRNRPGASLTFADLNDLAVAIQEQTEAGATGVVVTQGTDTIEETAFYLDLLHAGQQPVVVTGAMRNPTLAGADGSANILGAVSVASSTRTRGLGCLVAFADEIHQASRVRKTHSTSLTTFQSVNGGPLGYIVEGAPHVINRPTTRLILPLAPRSEPRVGSYTATLGDDGVPLAAMAGKVDGLVVAGFGVGHVPELWVPILADLATRIPMVLASRTTAGPVLSATYGFPGSERDLLAKGLISAGFLDPHKARILLHLTLAAGADRQQIAAAFRAAGSHDSGSWPWPHNNAETGQGSGYSDAQH